MCRAKSRKQKPKAICLPWARYRYNAKKNNIAPAVMKGVLEPLRTMQINELITAATLRIISLLAVICAKNQGIKETQKSPIIIELPKAPKHL
jgi:hypothetical protein